jgi:corticosteroid 11-beta-dehydrogenase isozyme 1
MAIHRNYAVDLFFIFAIVFIAWLLFGLYNIIPVDVQAAIKGKRVIVTGASLGIGKALVWEFVRQKAAQIVITSRSVDKLNNLKAEIISAGFQGEVHVVAVDLSSDASAKFLIDASLQQMGGLDYLVLNHITTPRFGTWMVDNAKDRSFVPEIFNVNAISYIYTATYALEALKKSGGHITVVSSLAAHVGMPKTAVYAASKHAIQGFFDALRIEFQIDKEYSNVGITIASIGATDTEGAAEIKTQLKANVKFDPPDYAARAIIKGAAARDREVFYPHILVFPVKVINTFFPSLVDWILLNHI